MDNDQKENVFDINVGEESLPLEEQMDQIDIDEFDDDSIEDSEPAIDDSFYVNILSEIDESKLSKLVSDLDSSIESDKESRDEYDRATAEGIDQLGFDRSDKSGAPFPGASVVKTPILAQAAIEFQSQAQKELMPISGPARGVVAGDSIDDEIAAARSRVEAYNNFLLTVGMEDYQEGFDQLLFFLSLVGSVFRKVHYSGSEVKVSSCLGLQNPCHHALA